ncbi:hypothetical protein GW17_00010606 [Ensete ventricosum]|nr:hypothetical protein GW17_00010606 [Ensete ventricosum]
MGTEGISHRKLHVNGINMHVAEKGDGPVVLFVHGFPELWYSWRHQIVSLAARGYHAVAPDLRGYGDSDAPHTASAYTILHLVGDLVALIHALGQDQVTCFPDGDDDSLSDSYMSTYIVMWRTDRHRCLWWGTIGARPWRARDNVVSEWDKHTQRHLPYKRGGPSWAVWRTASTRNRLGENGHRDVGKGVAQRSGHPGLAFRGMANPLRERHHEDKQAKKNV